MFEFADVRDLQQSRPGVGQTAELAGLRIEAHMKRVLEVGRRTDDRLVAGELVGLALALLARLLFMLGGAFLMRLAVCLPAFRRLFRQRLLVNWNIVAVQFGLVVELTVVLVEQLIRKLIGELLLTAQQLVGQLGKRRMWTIVIFEIKIDRQICGRLAELV